MKKSCDRNSACPRHTAKNFIQAGVIAVAFLLSCFVQSAFAQVNVAGDWNGLYDLGGGSQSIAFTLQQENTQDGAVITGLAPGDSNQATILGSLNGIDLVIRFGFTELAYSIDIVAQTDGLNILGSATDSNALTGFFVAARSGPVAPLPLTPKTTIVAPPTAAVSNRNVTLTLQKFQKPVFNKSTRAFPRANKPRGAVQYEVTIKGAERRKIIGKKNVVTARNLKPGSYQVTYRVTALKDEKKAFSTKPSPAASFTIRGESDI